MHIDPRETGITYIQFGLSNNAADLKRAGVLVPMHWQGNRENPSVRTHCLSQKIMVAANVMADMKVWAQRS